MANEMRLIDANALRKAIDLCDIDTFTDKQTICEQIAEAPTVDAKPVVHGHWVSLTDCSNAGVYCSVCHKKVYKEDYAWCNRKNKLRSNYCPNCGADMRDGDGNA